jgi:hypothetical protein
VVCPESGERHRRIRIQIGKRDGHISQGEDEARKDKCACPFFLPAATRRAGHTRRCARSDSPSAWRPRRAGRWCRTRVPGAGCTTRTAGPAPLLLDREQAKRLVDGAARVLVAGSGHDAQRGRPVLQCQPVQRRQVGALVRQQAERDSLVLKSRADVSVQLAGVVGEAILPGARVTDPVDSHGFEGRGRRLPGRLDGVGSQWLLLVPLWVLRLPRHGSHEQQGSQSAGNGQSAEHGAPRGKGRHEDVGLQGLLP